MMFIAAISAGCVSVETRKETQQIDIATDVYLVLPGASELTASFDATQIIIADHGDEKHSFEAHLEARPGKITIVAVSAIGTVLFSITYDGMELQARGVVEAQAVNAEYVLADVLLSYWDSQWLAMHVKGAVFDVSPGGTARTVVRQGEAIIRIIHETPELWNGKTEFANLERGYALLINTVEFAEL
jgi:hypothetical protein